MRKKSDSPLTPKEEELMSLLWQHGPHTVRELLDFYPEPKPHFNTVSTFVRKLEEKGYAGHTMLENGSYRYHATARPDSFRRNTLGKVISNYFANSYLSAVSSLIDDEKISLDELRELIQKVEESRKQSGK